jgi:hypothetical protein
VFQHSAQMTAKDVEVAIPSAAAMLIVVSMVKQVH